MRNPISVVLVPWRPSPEREPLWEHVRAHLRGLGLPIVTSDSDSSTFSIAQAFNAAADRPWDKAVLSEADVFCPLGQIAEALTMPGLVWCFDRQLRLTRPETRRLLESGVLPSRPAEPAASRLGFNGVRVIDRALWDEVGGYDDRFIGWGAEDNDFAWRLMDANAPMSRIPGVQVELAHAHDTEYLRSRTRNRALLAQKHPGRYP